MTRDISAVMGETLPASALPVEFVATARTQRWPLGQMVAMVERGYRGDEALQKLALQAASPETATAQSATLWSQIMAAMMRSGAIRTIVHVDRGSRTLHAITRCVVQTFVFIVQFLAFGYLVFTGVARLAPEHPPVWTNWTEGLIAYFGTCGQSGAALMATCLRVFGIAIDSPWMAGGVLVIGWLMLRVFNCFLDVVESRPVRILDRHWTTLVKAVGCHESCQWGAARTEAMADSEYHRAEETQSASVSESFAAERIAVVQAALEQLGREWGEYELDLNAYCWTKPVLRKADDPYTAAYTRAYSDLVHLTDQLGGPDTDDRLIAAAEAAAEKALSAWAEADAHALAVGNTDLDLIERTALRRLLKQVNLLADEATPQANWPQLRAAIDREIAKITTVPVRRQVLVRYLELEAPGRLRAIEASATKATKGRETA
ncbi:Uncharacterised protein [Mycobacteroides abscessus subsp. abscessus]|nr:Uncharacterised protein [Mycobacteroides abscessus subsp. abscessus]SID07600.1 Uncharacterised protein [Mycobacteroides abscessus subsp. abscessus]SID34522.1 Uncharacterised protein [Mycobacteroides abscessus subsp. abscessus]SID41075.1 Uncharacterised protein [Mycobacteroides abscessus subsp. abscessus]SKT65879.1 Uncharacterised protein [Mycobacteroides abscessus subsp. abscessus]